MNIFFKNGRYYSEKTQAEIVEILENADKYKWHDLRKNPEDLPETFVEVWICFTDYKYSGDEKFYDKAGRRDEDWCWEGDDTLLNERYQIIGWAYIKPFEVEEC